jgi:uncharacterized phage protein (TIGR01671 family)
MREIKFRGKCTKESKYNNKWVEGSLVVCDDGSALIVQALNDHNTMTYHVKPDTVGQFTGLLDKNGKEVYEGDIATDGKYYYTVEFSNYSCGFVWSRHGSSSDFHFERINDSEEMKVIGNIHDNSELLTK